MSLVRDYVDAITGSNTVPTFGIYVTSETCKCGGKMGLVKLSDAGFKKVCIRQEKNDSGFIRNIPGCGNVGDKLYLSFNFR